MKPDMLVLAGINHPVSTKAGKGSPCSELYPISPLPSSFYQVFYYLRSLDVSSVSDHRDTGHHLMFTQYATGDLSERCEYCKGKGWCREMVVCQWLYVAGPCATACYFSTDAGGGGITSSGTRSRIGRDYILMQLTFASHF